MNIAAREEIIKEQWSVDNLQDFLDWVKAGTKVRLKNKTFILEIQQAIWWNDPIVHLLRLYYDQEKSLDEIIKTLNSDWVVCPSRASLHRLLFIQFAWIPRLNTTRTPVHEKQLSARVKAEIWEFESKVAGLIWWREVERVFRMEEFKWKNFRIGKALYILKTLWGIDKNMLYTLSVEWGLSHAILAKSLNKELERILETTPELWIDFDDIKLYPQSINRWFRYNADKYQRKD